MRIIIILALLVATVNFAYSQESKKYLKLKRSSDYEEGYILKDSSKVKGLIKVSLRNMAKKYSVVTFVYIDGTKRQFYPNEIEGFGYFIYKFVSDDQSSFYKVVQIGNKVSLYTNISVDYWSVPGAGTSSTMHSSSNEAFYVKKANEAFFKLVRKRKFKEEFSEYFKDCKAVTEEILSEELTYEDIKTIVRRYNYCR